ncbi:FecR family protein [Mucilaginibacter paludis]|uniref:Anti-FecI sigma factor, FecR n=1 Tax=Mucilaginibacter paludis DSM 18603 TaxID=714943 RepID=H1Y4U2_9SPHI|nr:FecR domain-containing protein [Mucilaginibacter paludis]EHQ28136.1 anti-FecI sigma factor, FecR [Mucilaginibacter paludis DSM 18603]
MILSFFKSSKKKSSEEDDAALKMSLTVDSFKSNPSPWDTTRMGDENETGERILNRLVSSINGAETQHRHRIRRLMTLSAAAIILTCLVAGFLFKDELLDHLLSSSNVLVETKPGERLKLTLPDGSNVTLNAGTRLSYPQRFNHKKREVVLLSGEAYFDIKHDIKKPFIVNADKTRTTVLGTAFNIRAYSFIGDVTVTVASGKVAVNSQSGQARGKACFLLPNEQITYNKTSGEMQKSEVKAQDAMGWMDGRLIFTNETFGQVAGLLENKYNVKIEFEDSTIASYHFSASFEPTENLNDVLDALTLTKGLQYTLKNQIVQISRAKP